MPSDYQVRPAEPSDVNQVVQWSLSTPSNGFNSRLSKYPLLQTFVVEQDGVPLIYVPWHPVMCIESVAVRPTITGEQYIAALLEAKAHTETIARELMFREIYTSSDYRPMVRTLRRHGYTDVPGTALRKLL